MSGAQVVLVRLKRRRQVDGHLFRSVITQATSSTPPANGRPTSNEHGVAGLMHKVTDDVGKAGCANDISGGDAMDVRGTDVPSRVEESRPFGQHGAIAAHSNSGDLDNTVPEPGTEPGRLDVDHTELVIEEAGAGKLRFRRGRSWRRRATLVCV